MNFAQAYHGRLALADLAAGSIADLPLSRDDLREGVGGTALNNILARRYPGALLLCAGPLGGSYAPASGLLTISFPAPSGKGLTHALSPLGHGAFLRQSGFDALVLTGKSSSPRIIRLSRGNCYLEGVEDEQALISRGKLRSILKRRSKDGRPAMILANSVNSANAALPAAAGSEYGSFPAGDIVGPALRERGILAISLEGRCALPAMPIPLDNPLRQAAAGIGGNKTAAFLQEAGVSSAAGSSLKSAACFHCPAPCLAWIKTGGNAHLLLGDHAAFAAAIAACGNNAAACLAACDEAGLSVKAVAPLLKNAQASEYAEIIAAAGQSDVPGYAPDEAPAPLEFNEAEQAACILGVCPRLVKRVSGLSRDLFDALLDEDAAADLAKTAKPAGQEVYR